MKWTSQALPAVALTLALTCAPQVTRAENSAQAAVEQALDAMSAGNLPGAEFILRSARNVSPHDPAVLDVLGVVLDQQRKWNDAESVYQAAVNAAPRSGSIRNNYGNHLLETDHPAEARQQFLQAVKADPADSNANVQLARLALNAKNGTAALNYLSHLPASERTKAPVLKLAGLAASNAGRPAEAERYFHNYVQAAPDDGQGNYLLGLAAYKANHFDEAHTALLQAAKDQPANSQVLYDLAVADLKLKRNLDALAVLGRAASLAPGEADTQKLLARTAAESGYFEDSVSAWNQYLQMHAQDEVALRERGFAQTAIGQNTEAGLTALRQYVAKHGNDPVGHYELGTALSPSDKDTALSELTTALEGNRSFTQALLARGVVRYRAGDVKEAAQDFANAATQQPRNGRIWDRLGEAQLAAGQTATAVQSLQKANALTPDDATVLLHLGRALQKQNQTAKANETFARYRQLRNKANGSPQEAGFVQFAGLSPNEQRARYREGVERTVGAHPENAEAQVRHLELLLEDGRIQEGEETAWTVLRLAPGRELLEQTADQLVGAGQYTVAEHFAQKALAAVGSSQKLQEALARSRTESMQGVGLPELSAATLK